MLFEETTPEEIEDGEIKPCSWCKGHRSAEGWRTCSVCGRKI